MLTPSKLHQELANHPDASISTLLSSNDIEGKELYNSLLDELAFSIHDAYSTVD